MVCPARVHVVQREYTHSWRACPITHLSCVASTPPVVAMEAVKKAASGAVESIRNSPLFRRKFGTYQKVGGRDTPLMMISDLTPPLLLQAHSEPHSDDEEPRPISPEKDRSPFVQGIYFQACRTFYEFRPTAV